MKSKMHYVKIMTGQQLVNIGINKDSDGYLISNTTSYSVDIKSKPWHIVLVTSTCKH